MPQWLAPASGVLLIALWCVWWLWAVDWRKVWPALAAGGWAPVVLLWLVAAGAWALIAPGESGVLGFVKIPNGWWQAGDVAALICLALFCGWLQGRLGWAPAEIPIEPPGHGSGHGHGHH
jgi:hypothetical protein